jgi:organic hydroperoxide reductase OsmC/OhrA
MAHEYRATVCWTREDGAAFTDGRYSRGHVWRFDGGLKVPASSAPASVPPPFSRPDAVDPEQAFVASLSSCHMLFVLWFAAKRGFVVDRYEDEAVGVMTKNERGKLFVSRVTLNPRIGFSGQAQPSPEDVADLHHRSHEECFIANSVLTEVVVAGLPVHA